MTPDEPDRLVELAGSVYGISIRGSLPPEFRPYLRPAAEITAGSQNALEVSFAVIRELPEMEPFWVSESGPTVAGRISLFRQAEGFGVRVEGDGHGLFRITSEAIRVEWLDGFADAARSFFAYALPLWLESRGIPVLHASAVAFDDRVVAFVGRSGIGKSTLCAGLVRAGCRFVADDGLPLREDDRGEWRCALGPPWLKLWPSALERGLGLSAEDLPRVQTTLEKRMMPCAWEDLADADDGPELAAVCVLEGRSTEDGDLEITACNTRDSLIHLIEHSLAGGPVAALGLSARRLDQLSRVAERIPVMHLGLPSGFDRWQEIRQEIWRHLIAGHEG